jgi:hypothetical protein
MERNIMHTTTSRIITLACAAAALACNPRTFAAEESWMDRAITPVANPLFFESPFIQSEVRPLMVYHNIDDSFIGGHVRVYAVQARWAVNDRLAIIATKDGFIELKSDVRALHSDGWADIGLGVKYALIDDRESNFILTPGVKFETTSGSRRVLQANGNGEVNAFVSAAKGWGDFHLTGSVGGRIPIDFDEETASLHYSLQADYYTCQWFIPFVALNGHTVLSEGDGLPLDFEGYDLINFGASDASGFTQLAFGVGFRSRLCKWADLGFAYEKGITSPKGLFDDRYTVDLVVRF